jgi:hypothetical protein
MKFTQKTFIDNCERCYRLAIFFTVVGLAYQGHAQILVDDVTMIDTIGYTDFGVTKIASVNYPPSNLFDGKLASCWVSDPSQKNTQSIFIRVPKTQNDSISLGIFSGYGKSKSLFRKNSRPREITLYFYSAHTPDGYVSEIAYQCKAFPLPESQQITLKDTFGIQQFKLMYTRNDIRAYGENNLHHLKKLNVIDSMALIRLDISDIYEGDRYKQDVCISEIFFDNCYAVIVDKEQKGEITDVYQNDAEDALWINKNDKAIEVYADSTSSLQIIEQSKDNEWAIVIAMPNDIYGRAEVTYMLFDLIQGKLINDKLKNILDAYNPGEPLYLNEIDGKVYIVNEAVKGEDTIVELRHYFY